jgi:hypothetical protein
MESVCWPVQTLGMLAERTGATIGFTVTVTPAVSVQVSFVTVTEYGVVAVGATVIACVVAPVDQRYEV